MCRSFGECIEFLLQSSDLLIIIVIREAHLTIALSIFTWHIRTRSLHSQLSLPNCMHGTWHHIQQPTFHTKFSSVHNEYRQSLNDSPYSFLVMHAINLGLPDIAMSMAPPPCGQWLCHLEIISRNVHIDLHIQISGSLGRLREVGLFRKCIS